MMVSHLARATLPDTGENATSAATETADTLPRRNQGDQEEQPPSPGTVSDSSCSGVPGSPRAGAITQ